MKTAQLYLLLLSLPIVLCSQDRGMKNEQQTVVPERRVALVIGNGAYKSITPLKNPPNDAQSMASMLKSLGFDVIAKINANKKEMRDAIQKFGMDIRGSGVGLFYYAGHGIQSSGRNYLIPVNAEVSSEGDVEDEAVSVDQILSRMGDAGNRLNIVILDACRNNPFSNFRSVGRGLTQMVAPSGTFIAYATAPGSVADDGGGSNGVYTQALLRNIQEPGVQLEDVFKNVLSDVKRQTGNKQVPWTSSSAEGRFFFAKSSTDGHLPPTSLPNKPQSKALNLSDLDAAARKEEDVKNAWSNTLKQMKTDFEGVLSYEKRDVSAELKTEAWTRFMSTYAEDDPYSSEDDAMRSKAQTQSNYWKDYRVTTTKPFEKQPVASNSLTAEEIFSKFMENSGGKARIDGVRDRTIELSGQMSNYSVKIKIICKAPNKIYQETKIIGLMEKTIGFDGNKGWSSDPQGVVDIEGPELESLKISGASNFYDQFKGLGYNAKLIGVKNINGRDCYEVSFAKGSGSGIRQYFDSRDFLLCRQATVLTTPQGSSEQTADMSDYKEFNGYLMYTKLSQSYMGITTEFTLDRFIVNSGIDDKIFSKPQGK